MQLVSYRNTEAGARERQSRKFEAEMIVMAERKARMAEEVRAMKEIRSAQEDKVRAIKADALCALRDANIALAKLGLRDAQLIHCTNPDNIKRIAHRVCKAFGVTHKELTGPRRAPRIVLCRQAVAYWACRRTNLSLPQIGRYLERDHTTIMYSKRIYPVRRFEMKPARNLREVR
jgi:chromosomal replication initiation ATPase DnaA